MKKKLWKLPENRIRRNYRGGFGIDVLRGKIVCEDNDKPEEWVGSMVEASNPGMLPIAQEGLGIVTLNGKEQYLRDVVDSDKEFYLGDSLRKDGSWQLSFLLKILDSAMRLHVQAHPSSEFAQSVMEEPYGKLECYYILGVREGIEPYIRLGFQHAPSKEEWKEIIETQNKEKMDACFEKIQVKPGEVWYIPGGMPHAIGEGITMLEIMEPSDLVVRCEYEREGIVVPEDARFMGKGLDFCLDIFDYREYSKEEIQKKCRILPVLLEKTESYERQRLTDETLTSCFFAEKLNVRENAQITHNGHFMLGVVCSGCCVIQADDCRIELSTGDSFAVAAAVREYTVITETDTEICTVYPGTRMKI